MKSMFSIHQFSKLFLIVLAINFASCGSSSTDGDNSSLKKDTISTSTDQTEMLEIEEIEMQTMYEVTNTKTNKTTLMSQDEYLESAIWENPDCVVKEISIIK